MNCYICQSETKRLIAPPDSKDGILYGPCCYQRRIRKQGYDHTLNQVLEQWSHIDKKNEKTVSHRLTKGKDWEIENRRISRDDPRAVINIKTGREAQY